MPKHLLDEDFLTEDEAGNVLGLKKTTLRVQAANRKGPPRVKIGRTVYYRKSSLLKWMLSKERNFDSATNTGTTGAA